MLIHSGPLAWASKAGEAVILDQKSAQCQNDLSQQSTLWS